MFNSAMPGLAKGALTASALNCYRPKQSKPKSDHWREMYLESLRDNARMSEKFAKHLEALEEAYKEKLDELQHTMDSKMEEAFEEAYKMLLELKQEQEKDGCQCHSGDGAKVCCHDKYDYENPPNAAK